MSSKLDFTLAVPKDLNMNHGTNSQQIISQPKPKPASSQQKSTLSTYEPSLFVKFLDWYVDLLPKIIVKGNGERVPVEVPFWKKAVGYIAMGIALPGIGIFVLLEKMGCIKYNPDRYDTDDGYEAAKNVAAEKR